MQRNQSIKYLFFTIVMLGVSNDLFARRRYEEPSEEAHIFIVVVATGLVLVLIAVLISIFRDLLIHVILKVPAFSEKYKKTPHNLRFAYKVAGCHIVVSDLGNRKDQYLFLVSYLKRLFPKLGRFDLSALPKLHMFYDDVNEVFRWIGKNCNQEERIQFIDYLVDLAFFNDKLSSREMKLIYLAGDHFQMSKAEIRSILTMRYKFYQDKEKRERQQRREHSRPKKVVRSKKKEALKILQIQNDNVSIDEVKKAYRNMAKKHHPDRFHTASKMQQQKANERFAIINDAYEYLQELLS